MAYDKWFAEWANLPAETTPITAEFLEHVETALDTQDNRIVTLEAETDGHVIQDEASALAQRPALNFTGSGVTVTDNAVNNRTDVSIGGGGGGHTIQDEGVAETDRAALNFLGSGVSVADDAANNRTNVTIPGATGGSSITGEIVLDSGSASTAGTAINNAMAALPVAGGTIIVPSGTWTIDTAVLWNKQGVTLKGVSDLSTKLVYAPGTVPVAIKMADTTQRFGCIRDLNIDATGASGGTALDASYFVSSTFERLRIGESGSTRPLIGIDHGTVETGTHYNVVRDCSIFVNGVGSYGLRYDNDSNHNSVYNVVVRGDSNTVALRTLAAHTTTLYNFDAEGTGAIGAQIRGNGTKLIGCYFEGLTLGLQLELDTEAFAMIGGYLECTTNLVDNGAIDPAFLGVWRSFENYTNLRPTPRIKTGSHTLTFFDADKTIEMESASATTVTVPPNSTVVIPRGVVIEVVRMGTGTVTIAAGAGVTLRTAKSLTARAQYSVVYLYKTDTNEWVVSGDLT